MHLLAGRAKLVAGMIVVLSQAHRSNVRGALPTALDLAGNVDGKGLSHGNLPCLKAGAQTGLSAIGGRADTDGSTKIGARTEITSVFVRGLLGRLCGWHADARRVADRISANRLGLVASYASKAR